MSKDYTSNNKCFIRFWKKLEWKHFFLNWFFEMLNLIDISINMGISSLKRYKCRYLYPFRELIPILIDTSSKLSISKKMFGFTKYRISSTKFLRRLLLFESIFICHISNDFFFFIKVLPYICAQLCAS